MKNTIKKVIYVILIIIATIIISLFAKQYLIEKSHSNITQENTNNYSNQITLEEAYVTKIVDGDTIWVKIGNEEKKVRFIGIDCPEYTKEIEQYGKEATEYTTEKLLNTMIYLQMDTTNTDSYNRLLRYVWTEKVSEINDENISNYLFNYALCYEGLAESKRYNPNTLLQNYLNIAQKNAKENNRGIWK